MPTHIHRCFEGMFKNRRSMNSVELLDTVKQHAGFPTTGGEYDTARAAADLLKV